MIEIGNLSDFNIVRKRNLADCKDEELVRIVQENSSSFSSIIFYLQKLRVFIQRTLTNFKMP